MYFSHYVSLRGGEQWPCPPQAHAFLVLLTLPALLPLEKTVWFFCVGYEGLTENPPS